MVALRTRMGNLFGRVIIFSIFLLPSITWSEEIRCFNTSPTTTICRNARGETVKTLVKGSDGSWTLTTKEGTMRCFTVNGTVVCR
jgi:hypothetical protein